MNLIIYLPTLDTRRVSAFSPVSELRGELLALMHTHKRIRVEFEVAERTVPASAITFDAYNPDWSTRLNTFLQSIPDLHLRYRPNTSRGQSRPLVTTSGYEVFVPKGEFRDRDIKGYCTSVADANVLALKYGGTHRQVHMVPCIMPNGAMHWYELGWALPITADMNDAFVVDDLNELHSEGIENSDAGTRWIMKKLTGASLWEDEFVVQGLLRCVALYLTVRSGHWKNGTITAQMFSRVILDGAFDEDIGFCLKSLTTRVRQRIAKLQEQKNAQSDTDLQGSGVPDSDAPPEAQSD